MNIGRKIRNLRINKKITQKDLAQKINVTSGYISQIENNLISPSLKILFSLLKIFKISASDFFQEEKNIELIHKKDNFLAVKETNLKNTTYYLFPYLTRYQIEPVIIEIESQGQTAINNDKKEDIFVFVLEGEIILILNQFRYFLKKGDTFYLFTNKKYYLLNQSKEKTKILKIISPEKKI
ncbi:helix-turn-helix domain-containing protein [Columbia Basin potato purple top phytoplasma]|uniref:XRE family transcriptional regulator n=1 Tax=Columbia Basin potato purple top phytoplasma TaxID=307134 RepID=A0ABT5L8F6_9MOLU|nr:XRE family transcriptional regulator [Columbia Basin potato purple top phytoplasma]MDC9031853.1 XRE family transcriptional regulator [Columbia Basin potato purple top phytoplasma]